MRAIKIAHFKSNIKNMYVNGGKLFIQNSEIIIKIFLKTVVTFKIDSFKWKLLQNDIIGYKTIDLSDNDNSYECKFFKKDFEIFQKEFIKFKV